VKVVAIPIRGVEIEEPERFMERLKAEVPNVTLQAIDARFVANLNHLWAVIRQAWMADRSGTARARFELEILLRIACDSRVTQAVTIVGLKKGSLDVIFVAVGKIEDIQPLPDRLSDLGEASESLLQLTSDKCKMLLRHHHISKEALESTITTSEGMSGVLAEKAAITLFR
jgi:tRNA threonylcarbamoyladenosine modification (KEOPS) complex Cgi121 subunit